MLLPSFRSMAQADSRAEENQSMLVEHWSSSIVVLQVPHTMSLRVSRSSCASIKASELWRRKEKARHDRNATVFVMLEKKLKHDTLEKFWLKSESNG